jgi:uncharacterized membrane protein YbaN (DUF454 family)
MSLLLAYFFLALAIVGAFLPVLPTVPFLILASWFAARGSERLHRWLYAHPVFGGLLIDWEREGAISRRAKVIAIMLLVVSWLVMYHKINNFWIVASAAVLFTMVSIYLISRPEPK